MKLIRLATNDNGNFSSSFGNEMILKPYAKMALLNLTFETNIGKITTDNSQKITTKTDAAEPNTSKTHTLDNREFAGTPEGNKEYRDYVIQGLNSSIAMTRGKLNESNSNGSQYTSIVNEDGTNSIVYRYAPFINALATKKVYADAPSAQDVPDFMNVDTNLLIAGLEEGILVETQVKDTNWVQTTAKPNEKQTNTNDRQNWAVSTTEISPGNGFMCIRILDLVDRAGAGNSNGFGIGLSKIPLGVGLPDGIGGFFGTGESITNAMSFADIHFNQTTGPYKFSTSISPDQEFSASFNPFKTGLLADPDPDTHDIMGFEIQGNTCTMCVYQSQTDTTLRRRVVATLDIPPGQKLYPYMYMRGAGTDVTGTATTDCVADMFNWTYNSLQYAKNGISELIDPIARIGWGPTEDNDWYKLMDYGGGGNYQGDAGGVLNGYAKMMDSLTGIPDGIPAIESRLINLAFARWDISFIQTTVLDSDLLEPFGFLQASSGDRELKNSNLKSIEWTSEFKGNALPFFYTSDNFLVISDTLPLDSYDASEVQYNTNAGQFPPSTEKTGRRKNILMTIPVNDNSEGLVEFETNTPIFIDINNAESINVKNLNLRILRKDFSPIKQTNQDAIMAILIEDGK